MAKAKYKKRADGRWGTTVWDGTYTDTFDLFNHSMVQLLINNNIGKPQTCKQIVITCKQIVRAAEKDRLLPRGSSLDIFDGLTIPPYTPAEKRPLTQPEKDALKAANFTPREKMFALLLYGTGFRCGEALALTVFDISFKDKTIKIDKALAFDKGKPYISSPKTKNSYRTNPIPDWLVQELKTYTNTLNLSEQSLLFCKRDGSLMDLNAYCRMWHSIVKKMKNSYLSQLRENQLRVVNWNEAGFEDLTAHIFRHNYCTSLCYQMVTQRNISTKKIARLLGDTEKMVLKVYSHILEDMEKPKDAIDAAVSL